MKNENSSKEELEFPVALTDSMSNRSAVPRKEAAAHTFQKWQLEPQPCATAGVGCPVACVGVETGTSLSVHDCTVPRQHLIPNKKGKKRTSDHGELEEVDRQSR